MDIGYSRQIVKYRKTKKKIVGINWGTSFNRICGSNEIIVEDQLAETAKKLIQKGYKIYMFIVWKADINPSLRLYKKINDTQNVRLSTKYYHQNDLLNILQSCHFTINLKLHANVISAAAGIPFITLGYRFKSFDFAHSVGQNDFIISTDSQTITKEIINNKEPFMKKQLQSYRNLYTKKLIQP
ncbi:polysaccharide pyruvyl transferase family protein [Peribacillus frigoritolerans]|uniref:polysaccharide pyruvyl transferase family protein n=1 Tax=Peribacillus frigoritolerans TaxID=450367 RepID=UPI0020403CDF|nr:polysaccharide pyruvyl transferase family protein [Peribacillus frigoritolerans]MCM3166847.1 polysaccharide pyruvyl transferase family protein [Peribacillus frigoritolerans]